jgi:hypothetical protein
VDDELEDDPPEDEPPADDPPELDDPPEDDPPEDDPPEDDPLPLPEDDPLPLPEDELVDDAALSDFLSELELLSEVLSDDESDLPLPTDSLLLPSLFLPLAAASRLSLR